MRLRREMVSTNSIPPRGISKSTSRSRFNNSITSLREWSNRAAADGIPLSCKAEFQMLIRISFVRAASLPPLSKMALPDFSASEATCGTTSGRDSKTTATTPKGQVSLVKIRPSSSSVILNFRPTGSARRTTLSTFSAISATERSVTRRRASMA